METRPASSTPSTREQVLDIVREYNKNHVDPKTKEDIEELEVIEETSDVVWIRPKYYNTIWFPMEIFTSLKAVTKEYMLVTSQNLNGYHTPTIIVFGL